MHFSSSAGEKTWDGDGQKGGISRRLKEMYTNLGSKEDWGTISLIISRGRRLLVIPIEIVLRNGEEV